MSINRSWVWDRPAWIITLSASWNNICVGDPVHMIIVDPKNKIRNEVNTKESCCVPESPGIGETVSVSVGVVAARRALHVEGEHIQYSGLTHAPRWFAGSFDMPNGQQGGSAPLFVMTMCVVETVEVPH